MGEVIKLSSGNARDPEVMVGRRLKILYEKKLTQWTHEDYLTGKKKR